jgi:hypothetical protein
MNRRRLLWSAVAGVLALLALLCAFEAGLLPWPWGLEARARGIQPGMTESEVDAVLGGPPAIKAPWTGADGLPVKPGWRAVWYSDSGNVAVDFGGNGRVEALPLFVAPP